eukprot:403362383
MDRVINNKKQNENSNSSKQGNSKNLGNSGQYSNSSKSVVEQDHHYAAQRRVYTEGPSQFLQEGEEDDYQLQEMQMIDPLSFINNNNKSKQKQHINIDKFEFINDEDSAALEHQYDQNEDEEIDLDEITPEEFQELMKNPKLAALFANASNGGHDGFEYEIDNRRLVADEDDEDYDYEEIDLDNLPNDQQQYFLQDDSNNDSQNNSCQVQFLNQSQAQEEYNRDHIIEGEDGEIIHQDVDSDYCEDLIEVYHHNGDDDDVNRYKGIHLMVKEEEFDVNGQLINESQLDKYQCPETGSHFEFLDMCQRLKRLKKRRDVIDKVIDDENVRRLALIQKQKNQKSERSNNTRSIVLNQSQHSNKKIQSSKLAESSKFTSMHIHQSDFKENMSDLSSVKVKDSMKASMHLENSEQNSNQQEQQYTRNMPVQILAKVKQMKEAYIQKPLPTENNLMTEEGMYNSFHFIGTQDTNKFKKTDRYNQEETQIQEEDLINQLNQKNQVDQKKSKAQYNKNILKNLLNNPPERKQQICVTEAGPDSHNGKLNKKRQEEYNMFFNSNVESLPKPTKSINLKGQQNFVSNYQQQNTFDGRTQKELDLLSLSQMLINQQQREHDANNIVKLQPQYSQPNVFKFKKSTEKLSNKRTPSAHSKSKKRNNSQSIGSNIFHNKTHSFNQIGGITSTNNKQSQIQQLLQSFYQGQNNPITSQNQSRTNYSKSIYEMKGNHTIRDSSRTNTQPIGPKILVSGATKAKAQGSINQIYASMSSNNGKLNLSKPVASTQKRSKINLKSTNNNGLQPRGNTLDARYSSTQGMGTQISMQNQHAKQVLLQFNDMLITNKTSSNGVASNSTTVGMNSQNASRPASAIKKMNGQSPSHIIMNGKVTNLQSNEMKNILSYNQKHLVNAKDNLLSIQKGVMKSFENQKIHKKTSSVSQPSKYSNSNIHKSRQKVASHQIAPSHVDYNSLALDQILYSNLETQPAEYNYSTFNEGLMTSADQDRVYTMNSNKKSSKNPFIQNTASSQKSRQKSTSKISTSKSRQKNDLFKPMQISSHIKQNAKLRTKPQIQMSKQPISINFIPCILELDINNVMDKINAKQLEASRASAAHPITSLTHHSLVKSKNALSSNQQTTQHSSIVQSHQNIQSQLAQASKKMRSSQLQANEINLQHFDSQKSKQSYGIVNNISKRYNSIKSSGREKEFAPTTTGSNHINTRIEKQRTHSKASTNTQKHVRLGSGNPKTNIHLNYNNQNYNNINLVGFSSTNNPFLAMGLQSAQGITGGKKKNILTGASYDFRSERCETVN